MDTIFFPDWISIYIVLDIDTCITIQRLTSYYKLKQGCCNKDPSFSGVVQLYIYNCIVGSRCMANSNNMYHVKAPIAEIDACSLYPRAMDRTLGYLISTPRMLDRTGFN